jgi:hypothetical protein
MDRTFPTDIARQLRDPAHRRTERYPTKGWREIGSLIRNTAPHPGSLLADI